MIKKIKTEEEIAKEKKRNQVIVVVLMLGVLVVSSAGYAILESSSNNSSAEKQTHNGFKFTKVGSLWSLQLNSGTFYFQYLPQELNETAVYGNYNLDNYKNKPLYFVNNNVASNEILRNLDSFVQRYQEACFENCTGDLPEKTCEDNLIIFEPADKTKVSRDGNCIYITGESLKGADAFLYKLLGVTNG